MTKQGAAINAANQHRYQRYDRVSISLRLRQRARLRVVPESAQGRVGCDVTVLLCRDDQRFEIHREVNTAGRLRWLAVEIRGDELYDSRPAQRRWEAAQICQAWIASSPIGAR